MTPSKNKKPKRRMEKAQKASEEIRKSMRNQGEQPEFPQGLEDTRNVVKKAIIARSLSFSDQENKNSSSAERASSSTPRTNDEMVTPKEPPDKGTKINESHKESENNYPNVSDDPDPISDDAKPEQKEAHLEEIRRYTNGLYKTYEYLKMEGEDLW